MKSIAKLLLLAVILMLVAGGLALTVALEDTPALKTRADLTPEQIARGKQIFRLNDPRRLKSGAIAMASLNQEDLELAINYFAHQFARGAASLQIEKGRALIRTTLEVPANPLGRFLNLQLVLKQNIPLPRVEQLRLGKLPVPAALAEPLFDWSLAILQGKTDTPPLATIVKHVQFQPRQMIVTYRWQADLPAKLRGALLSGDDQARSEAYQRRLAALSQQPETQLSMTVLSKPLFKLAAERSQDGDPVAENRALILVLTFYANRQNLAKIIPQAAGWPRPGWRTLTLNGRDDLAKHYLVSAMLAAYSGTPLADAVGLYKEIEDSRGGSGFSFNDLAADRAGTRMGEQAIADEAQARKIQRLMATADESQMMPATADLAESMPEAEFIRRFGGTEGQTYRQMMQDIERRIAALPVNRD